MTPADLLALLREVEWADGESEGFANCFWCNQHRNRGAHLGDCKLAAAIRWLEAEVEKV